VLGSCKGRSRYFPADKILKSFDFQVQGLITGQDNFLTNGRDNLWTFFPSFYSSYFDDEEELSVFTK
jgi:hypothetical protein